MLKDPKIHLSKDISTGLFDEFEEEITVEKIREFSKMSGDYNPLHNDLDFAKELGKPDLIAHGAIQQYLISRLAGMYLPGKYCILKKIDTTYLQPIYPNQKVITKGTVTKWSEKNVDGQLEIKITDLSRQLLFSISHVHFGLTVKNTAIMTIDPPEVKVAKNEKTSAGSGKKKVLLVGGTGGIGQELKSKFEADDCYEVLISGRNQDTPNLNYDPISESNSFGNTLNDFCIENNVYAVLFLASKPPLKQSLTQFNLDDFFDNLKLHLKPIRDLSFGIKDGRNSVTKRLIVMGSSFSREHFFEYGLESYGYVKQVTKNFVQDLSRELARVENVTLNMVSPSEIASGMNANMSERSKQIVGAKLPSGKMVTVSDLYGAITMLLEENASMVKGQEFLLSGGRVR